MATTTAKAVIGTFFTDLKRAKEVAKRKSRMFGRKQRFVILKMGKGFLVVSKKQYD